MSETAADFTEGAYRRLVASAVERFAVLGLREAAALDGVARGPCTLWRHDIDFSPHRARALARIEAAVGLKAVYYVLPNGPFYNPCEAPVIAVLREIAALGHELGLHFDASLDHTDLAGRMRAEADMLSQIIGQPVQSVSIHNPGTVDLSRFSAPMLGDLINATSDALRAKFTYCSDSHGIWRFRSLHEVVDDPAVDRLYALTHPEWWTPEPLPPAERIRRCIDGRAAAVASGYVDFITSYRPEVLVHVR